MPDLKDHEKYMARCLQLAKLGKGYVSPNPLVGSIIVHEGKIIGEGYHQEYGQAHAEVNAINSVNDKERGLLKSSTIYINLEPCAHFGKTPPCADLIIKNNIKTVVIGCIDPYTEVAGKGVEKLNKAGVEVIVDVLNKECLSLNKRFFKFHKHERPYIILKWAESSDGFIDRDRVENEKGIFWISHPDTKSLVHKWRAEEDSILVGRNTIEIDDPKLTCRKYHGKNPIRIVIDQHKKLLASNYNIGKGETPTIIFNDSVDTAKENVKWIKVAPFTLKNILTSLYNQNIQSIIVEGGKKTLESFIDENIWDEIRIITGVSPIIKGKKSPQIHFGPNHHFFFGKDKITIIQQ